MSEIRHLSLEELEAGLEHIRQSPKDNGALQMIVRRPEVDSREEITEAELNTEIGLVGDNWKVRGNPHTADGSAKVDAQITLMNARAVTLLAQSKDRWALAGDQLYIDMELSDENLPAGTRLTIGTAVLEVTPEPHTGCKKFAERYGTDATKFVNSKEGKRLHLRGIYARVVEAGMIRVGDVATKS
ncbi:MAG: MOSC domain-containing protein [Anaerolineales bacterium]|nr:MOSC domain-containing protein [Anaerolineales bacterium]